MGYRNKGYKSNKKSHHKERDDDRDYRKWDKDRDDDDRGSRDRDDDDGYSGKGYGMKHHKNKSDHDGDSHHGKGHGKGHDDHGNGYGKGHHKRDHDSDDHHHGKGYGKDHHKDHDHDCDDGHHGNGHHNHGKGHGKGHDDHGNGHGYGHHHGCDNGGGNNAPTANNANYSINEGALAGVLVGFVEASDPDQGDVLSYEIISGNDNLAFSIDSETGEIVVANAAALDHESQDSYELQVKVTDSEGATDTASITVAINDVNEAPSLPDENYSVDENSANGTVVGLMSGSDPDAEDVLSYSIVGGNDDNAFSIDSETGEIIVSDGSVLDFESQASYSLEVKVTDSGGLMSTAVVAIALGDVVENQAPSVNDESFAIDENSANGTVVGAMNGVDPDLGDVLNYSIVSGNEAGAFSIDSDTGEILVANSSLLDYENEATLYNLEVKVTDSGGLMDTAMVDIGVNDVDEPLVAYLENFIDEVPVDLDLSNPFKIADLVVEDPDGAAGQATTQLVGQDAGLFQLDIVIFPVAGIALYLRANADLSSITDGTLDLAIEVDDPSLLPDPDISLPIQIAILPGDVGGPGALIGTAGDDVLVGTAAADVMDGLAGNDSLNGRLGNDTLTGGSGNDTFVFAVGGGNDIVTDFDSAEDQVDLTAFGLFNFNSVLSLTNQVGADAVISFFPFDTLTLQGVDKSSLEVDDFLL